MKIFDCRHRQNSKEKRSIEALTYGRALRYCSERGSSLNSRVPSEEPSTQQQQWHTAAKQQQQAESESENNLWHTHLFATVADSTVEISASSAAMHIVGISSSLRAASSNTGLLRAAEKYLIAQGHSYEIIVPTFPLFNQDIEENPPDEVKLFRERVDKADAFLFATCNRNTTL